MKAKSKSIRRKKITSMTGLINDLWNIYSDVKKDKISLSAAKTKVNTAGKIISACKTQLDYNLFMKRRKKIKFLEN